MADDILRIGFVGAGKVNFGGAEGPWDHASRIETFPNVKVVGIADPLEDAAKRVLETRKLGKYAGKYADCALFKNVDELLEKAKPDIVIIGTPPFCRGSLDEGKDIELKCVKAGAHVLVEKPVSLSPPEDFRKYVREVEKAQEETGKMVSVGYMFRYHGALRKMKEVIGNHGGPVMVVNATYMCAYEFLDNAYWWDSRKSGGPVVEQATHLCDLVRYLGGDIVESSIVTRCLRDDGPGTPGHLSKIPANCDIGLPYEARNPRGSLAQWRFVRGGLGSLTHTISLHGKKYEAHLEVIMDGLRLYLNDPYTSGCSLIVRTSSSEEDQVFKFPDDDPYMTEVCDFIEAIRAKKSDTIASTYSDAAKTYCFTCAIKAAEIQN